MSEAHVRNRYKKCLDEINTTRIKIEDLNKLLDTSQVDSDLRKCINYKIKKLTNRLEFLRNLKTKLLIQKQGFWSQQPERIRKLIEERNYWKEQAKKSCLKESELISELSNLRVKELIKENAELQDEVSELKHTIKVLKNTLNIRLP